MSTSVSQSVTPTKRGHRRDSSAENTALLHVNLPASMVAAIRALAAEERRTITSQVELLLEESPELQDFIRTVESEL